MRTLLQPRWDRKGKALKRKTRSNNTNDGKMIMILIERDTLPSAPAPAGRVVSLLQLSLVHQHIVCCYVSISFIFIFKDSEREGRWLHDLIFWQHFNINQEQTNLSNPLRAESARAFTGRRNSHSGRGENFLSRQPNFFTETAVTPERKVEKWFPRWEINRHAEG